MNVDTITCGTARNRVAAGTRTLISEEAAADWRRQMESTNDAGDDRPWVVP